MNAPVTNLPVERKSVLHTMASRYSMEPANFEATLRATVVPIACTREQFAACLVVANEYKLNPLTKEIYFFPARGGGIVPVVGVDGWARIINEHPAFDGMEFDTAFVNDKPFSVTCRMFRKDRGRPIAVTEFFSECNRSTDPWKQSPARMLRHKAMIQGARYAFGFAGIYDPDEVERIAGDGDNARDITPPQPPAPPQIVHQRAVAEMAGEQASRPPTPPTPPKPPAAPAEVFDPEALRKRFEAAAKAAPDADALNDIWDQIVRPFEKEIFPPDMDDLLSLFRRRERELEP